MLKFVNGEVNPSVRNDKCLFFSSHFKLGCQHLNTVWRILPNLLGEGAGYPQVRPKKFCQFWSKKVILLVIFDIFLAFFGPFYNLFGSFLALFKTKKAFSALLGKQNSGKSIAGGEGVGYPLRPLKVFKQMIFR